MVAMETIIAVSIGVLAAIFFGSLVALVLLCRQKYRERMSPFYRRCFTNKSNLTLIDQERFPDVELNDVGLYPEIDEILENDQWVNDTTGMIPHCLAILKTCHHLTERLVAMTIGNVSPNKQQRLSEIIDAARRISPCVDDVVRSMYPPLDARLLEARSSVLILSVRYLALVTSSICQMPLATKWIEEKLIEMEEHLQVLRDAGLCVEAAVKLQNFATNVKVNQNSESKQNIINNNSCNNVNKENLISYSNSSSS